MIFRVLILLLSFTLGACATNNSNRDPAWSWGGDKIDPSFQLILQGKASLGENQEKKDLIITLNPIGVDSIIQFGEEKYKAKLVKKKGTKFVPGDVKSMSEGRTAKNRDEWVLTPKANIEYVGLYEVTNAFHSNRKYEDFSERLSFDPNFPLKEIILSGDAAQSLCDDDKGFNARMVSVDNDAGHRFNGDRNSCLILTRK